MDRERAKELAAQLSEAFDALQGITIQAGAGNVAALDKVYGLLRYVYKGLTEGTEESADV